VLDLGKRQSIINTYQACLGLKREVHASRKEQRQEVGEKESVCKPETGIKTPRQRNEKIARKRHRKGYWVNRMTERHQSQEKRQQGKWRGS